MSEFDAVDGSSTGIAMCHIAVFEEGWRGSDFDPKAKFDLIALLAPDQSLALLVVV